MIYCFFQLLVGYMGGERSLLILLHGRPPKDAVFPFTLLRQELDLSDPHVFLFMKRGILRAYDSDPGIMRELIQLTRVRTDQAHTRDCHFNPQGAGKVQRG